MKTARVRELKHDLAKITRWLSLGEEVVLTRSGRPFARMVPHEAAGKSFRKPDFDAGLYEVWGDLRPFQNSKPSGFGMIFGEIDEGVCGHELPGATVYSGAYKRRRDYRGRPADRAPPP